MPQPLVSIILPVKNDARFLPEALACVVAQAHRPLEIIFVDGHSTDGSFSIAQNFPYPPGVDAQVFTQPATGVTDAWNAAVATAHGDLIAFIGADDRWLPGKLAAQVAALDADPHAAMAICKLRYFADGDYAAQGGVHARLLGQVYDALVLETLLVRRAVFDAIGGFDTAYALSADADWLTRAVERGHTVVSVPEVLVEKRLHNDSLSNRVEQIQHELLRLLRASVQRRRAEPNHP